MIRQFNLPMRKTNRKQAVWEKYLFLDMLSLRCLSDIEMGNIDGKLEIEEFGIQGRAPVCRFNLGLISM